MISNDFRVIENGIIPIYQKNNNHLVDARELHNFLGSKQQFSDWIKNRISKYEFIENVDFTLHKFMNAYQTEQTEYILTLDTAKELPT